MNLHAASATAPCSTRLAAFGLCLTLLGCAGLPASDPAALSSSAAPVASVWATQPAAAVAPPPSLAAMSADAPEAPGTTEAPVTQPTLVRGNDRMFAPPAARPPIRLSGERVSLNFDQAPITEVVHAVLGDLLGLPYAISQPVSGSVTIQTHNPLPQDQLFAVFESLLHSNGLAIVRDSSGIHHVGKPDTLRGIAPVFGSVGSLPAGHKLVVVPLRFIGAAAMAEIIEALAGPEALRRVDGARNLIVMAGTGPQVEGWLEIVNSFDVDMLAGMSVGLFPLQHISVQDMQAALKNVLAGVDATMARDADGGEPARSAGGPVGGVVRLMPIEQLNALLVVTPRAHYLDRVRDWIARFDRAGNSGTEPQLYVYPVQNGAAEHLAHLLNAVFGGELAQQPERLQAVAPGLQPVAIGDMATAGTMPIRGDGTTGNGGEVAQVTLAPDIRVVADVRNNALLIYAPPGAYGKVEAALRRLDIAPTQVLIEASILEVTLSDDLKYGLQWYFSGGIGGDRTGTGILGNSPTGQIASGGPGFSYTITNGVGEIRAVLNALAEKSLVNVISSPSVLVQDNHTATIQVGDQQPVRSSTTISDGGTTTSSIEFKDTGVMLSVTPSVNAGGLVSMMVDQSVTDVGQVDVATGQRSFLQRHISSRVAVRSGESVVLGGLIRDNAIRGRQGVPVLQEIPVFGALFSTTTNNASRTELLVMITPRVVRSETDLRQVGDELRRRMRSLETLPERIGGDYSARAARVE
ncbi:type II secretion system secretin GspD [Rhodocyclaceae bacterium SMB388]